jgi:hypothetical protein
VTSSSDDSKWNSPLFETVPIGTGTDCLPQIPHRHFRCTLNSTSSEVPVPWSGRELHYRQLRLHRPSLEYDQDCAGRASYTAAPELTESSRNTIRDRSAGTSTPARVPLVTHRRSRLIWTG